MRIIILVILMLLLAVPIVNAAEVFVIQKATDDKTFVINNRVFEAQTTCFGWREKDKVNFISGSPSGVCLQAELYNIDRNIRCKVKCKL
ncbi:MAG: hypothetical protein HQK91_10990 [Nitrospirae bacterium]|nr:hypothetical protein [Nitrospirota bacterium]MBF0541960.1 hypothetical protein [Nitrospirota bacterium]